MDPLGEGDRLPTNDNNNDIFVNPNKIRGYPRERVRYLVRRRRLGPSNIYTEPLTAYRCVLFGV
jgi:hypothetical protein